MTCENKHIFALHLRLALFLPLTDCGMRVRHLVCVCALNAIILSFCLVQWLIQWIFFSRQFGMFIMSYALFDCDKRKKPGRAVKH